MRPPKAEDNSRTAWYAKAEENERFLFGFRSVALYFMFMMLGIADTVQLPQLP